MPAQAQLDITEGVVTAVSLTSETVPRQTTRRHPRGGALADEVVNVLRVTVKGRDGKPRDFSFRNTTVGAAAGHTVAVVQAKKAGRRHPIPLMFVNESTGQRDEFPDGVRLAASQKGLAARWKAFIAATTVGLGAFAILHFAAYFGQQPWAAVLIALALTSGVFVALWGLIALADQVTLPAKDRAEVQRLRSEVNALLFAAKAPPTATSA